DLRAHGQDLAAAAAAAAAPELKPAPRAAWACPELAAAVAAAAPELRPASRAAWARRLRPRLLQRACARGAVRCPGTFVHALFMATRSPGRAGTGRRSARGRERAGTGRRTAKGGAGRCWG